MRKLCHLVVLGCLLFTFYGCLDDNLKDIDGIIAEPVVAFPIGKTSVTIQDFIAQDSVFEVGEDGFISIKYREENIISFAATDILSELTEGWNLNYQSEQPIGNANISGVEETGMFYMMALVNEIPDPLVRQFFDDQDGNMVVIPPFDQTVNFDIGIPVFDEFQMMEIHEGDLNFKAQNTYPFDLEEVTFEVWDNITGTLIGTVNRDLLRSNEIFEDQISLVGLSFNNSIFVRLKKFKSPGTTSPVLLNLQNRINVEMSIIELSISAGMVKVPQSTFGSVNDVANIQTVNSVKVKSAKIQSGKLSYQINSDVDLPLEILFELPSV